MADAVCAPWRGSHQCSCWLRSPSRHTTGCVTAIHSQPAIVLTKRLITPCCLDCTDCFSAQARVCLCTYHSSRHCPGVLQCFGGARGVSCSWCLPFFQFTWSFFRPGTIGGAGRTGD